MRAAAGREARRVAIISNLCRSPERATDEKKGNYGAERRGAEPAMHHMILAFRNIRRSESLRLLEMKMAAAAVAAAALEIQLTDDTSNRITVLHVRQRRRRFSRV